MVCPDLLSQSNKRSRSASVDVSTISGKRRGQVVLAGNQAEAVVLDLVQPLVAGKQFIGFGWEARRDEQGREGTLQHVD